MNSEDLKALEALIPTLPDRQKLEVLSLLEELERRRRAELCRTSLLDFVKHIDLTYKIGPHHRRLAAELELMAEGHKDRVVVNMAPRMGKSQLTSIYFPAWFMGRHPDRKLMIVSHTAELAVDFGRKVRNLLSDERYQEIFPGVTLATDTKAAGRWNTNRGGEVFCVGVGGAIAGRGADLLVIDDPHNEQDVLNGNFEVFEKAYQWYTYGARTRLMPGAGVAVVMTRWAVPDLTGRLVQDMVRNPGSDQWEVVEFPALFEKETPEGVTHTSLWPEQWSVEALLRTKASMPSFQWSAQYMQDPTAQESAIVKREWWRTWEEDEPPACAYIIMSLDSASEKGNRSDYSYLTTWGVFEQDNDSGLPENHIILLNAIRDRWEFPTLKRRVYEEYREWQPDWFVVEKKSSGTPLYQEMRASGVPVQEFTPHRGTGDKFVRLNSVSDIFSSGFVWYPAGRRWAEDLVEEVCGFPNMEYDDGVDSTVMALMKFRSGGFIRLPSDYDDDHEFMPRKANYY